VVAISLDVIALGSHLLAKHLETVVASFVHFARLALCAKVAVARRKFTDDAVQPKVAVTRCLLALHRYYHY